MSILTVLELMEITEILNKEFPAPKEIVMNSHTRITFISSSKDTRSSIELEAWVAKSLRRFSLTLDELNDVPGIISYLKEFAKRYE